MKKIILCFLFAFWGLIVNAQEFKWDVNAGYSIANNITKFNVLLSNPFSPGDPELQDPIITSKNSEDSFFLGLGGRYLFSEKVGLTGHLNYASYENTSFLQIPVLVNYFFGSSGLNIQAGPQFTYLIKDLGNFEVYVNKLNIGAGAGLGYDISKNLFVEARYVFQLNDQYKKEINRPGESAKVNYLNIGLGYRF